MKNKVREKKEETLVPRSSREMKKRKLAGDDKQRQAPMQITSSSSGIRRNWKGEPVEDQSK